MSEDRVIILSMVPTLCARCGANLDAVPAGEPCPSCGSSGRDVQVSVPAVNSQLTAGPVSAIVRQALGELAAMPEEARREVIQRLVELWSR